MSEKTDFGFEEVSPQEKTQRVRGVFQRVAAKYDVMNDVMSLGLHRIWKRFALQLMALQPQHKVLDLAGGTGDISLLMQKTIRTPGEIILADINASMLQVARDRFIDAGINPTDQLIQADAESLPFEDNYFDRVIIGFGLRNVTRKENALKSIYRVLKPGGQLLVLEFSKPTVAPLQSIYDFYSFKIVPKLGEWIANDAASYQYLVESIRRHPDQDALKNLFEQAGFINCDYHNLSGGIVAAHRGYK